jgi:hypothetical protein
MNPPHPRDRAAILAAHLGGGSGTASGCIARPSELAAAPTAAPDARADPGDLQYAVALPEVLDAPGPWPVRR